MQNLLDYFTKGTEGTLTGGTWGAEIETHFVNVTGEPISERVARQILAATPPGDWEVKPDLGRQLIELAIGPQVSPEVLLDTTHTALRWLYDVAAQYSARPFLQPVLDWPGDLLLEPADDADGDRDRIFFALDGRPALENLCRITAVQFTISVAPSEAIDWVNRLWNANLHRISEYPNDAYWVRYIKEAKAGYDPLRYGGPTHFIDITDYVTQLAQQPVVMHEGQICSMPATKLGGSHEAISLFLRSVWWYYRLRRYGDTLALEIRPFARRSDAAIAESLQTVRTILSV